MSLEAPLTGTGEQGTDQWLLDRAGKFTGSEFVNVLARNQKTGLPLKAYSDLLWQIAVERMTKLPEVSPNSFAMRWGKDVEPFAREAYEMDTGLMVTTSNFVTHPKYEFAGCSPDGLVDPDGGLEMKCPKSSAIHLARFIDGMPDEHMAQVQGGMWVCERAWWDFVSYDPRFEESHRLFRVRVMRDEAYIKDLEAKVIEAEEKVQEILFRVNMGTAPAPKVAAGLVDAITDLAKYGSVSDLTGFAKDLHPDILQDPRFSKAFKARLDVVKVTKTARQKEAA